MLSDKSRTGLCCDSSYVRSRARHIFHYAHANRVGSHKHNHGKCGGHVFERQRHAPGWNEHDVRLAVDDFARDFLVTVRSALGRPPLDYEILAFNVAEPPQRLKKCRIEFVVSGFLGEISDRSGW